MKRVLATLFGATMLLTAFGVTAVSADPGPNGHNEKGLCTAYFNGQKKGHQEGEGPGPFGVLETEYEDDGTDEDADVPGETRIASDVFERCNGLIGGNPEHNGRFDCSDDEADKKAGSPRDSDEDGQFECLDNT
jgi:hypothetical protein